MAVAVVFHLNISERTLFDDFHHFPLLIILCYYYYHYYYYFIFVLFKDCLDG